MVKAYNTKSTYFPMRITENMRNIFDHPLTIVEAPMGYGKTTAIREYLSHSKVNILWQRVYDDSTNNFWAEFCRLLDILDHNNSQSLLQLGFPEDILSIKEACNLIAAIKPADNTVLVIDDYHLIDNPATDRMMEMLAENEIPNLHVILIARYTKFQCLEELILKGYLHHITKDTFEFLPNDIIGYYQACGIPLTVKDAEGLFATTEGWISALYLMMLQYLADGNYAPAKNVYGLIEKTVFTPLADQTKEFLVTMSPFDNFTQEQAAYIWGGKNVSQLLHEITTRNAFISYDIVLKTYHIHSIFLGLLKDKLEKKDQTFRNNLYHKAAQWYENNGNHAAARHYFYLCQDFDGILAALEADKAMIFTFADKELLKKYFCECPEETKAIHHYAVLKFALCLFIHNETALFSQVCQELPPNIMRDRTLSQIEREQIIGELELLLSFTAFNDLKQMHIHHQKAAQLMQQTVSVYTNKIHWTFGSPSVLYLYYRESGKLSEHIQYMIENMDVYCRLTDGHGSGAEYLMEAEWHFNQGNLENAQISLQKAFMKAKLANESTILLCVDFLQIRIALLQGDFNQVLKLLYKMRQDMINKAYLHTVEICESCVYGWLNQPDKISQQLLATDLKSMHLAYPAFGAFYIVCGRALLVKGDYLKLIGSAEHYIATDSVFSNLLGIVYTNIYLAAANKKIGREEKALDCLKKALSIALPDNLYMPFVENCDYIEPLLIKLAENNCCQEGVTKILQLYQSYRVAIRQIISEYFSTPQPKLTKRETEIARLAAAGLSNQQIGEQLFISGNTVKSALKSVYHKLSINNRTLLQQYLEDYKQL